MIIYITVFNEAISGMFSVLHRDGAEFVMFGIDLGSSCEVPEGQNEEWSLKYLSCVLVDCLCEMCDVTAIVWSIFVTQNYS